MIELSLIAEIGVAIGTFALAVGTFILARQGRLQLKELRKENLLSRSKSEPILKVTDFKFIGNQSRAVITNVGNGRAVEIGMSVDFTPSESEQIKISAKFEIDGIQVHPTEIINFPTEGKLMILDQKETGILSVDTLFGMGREEKIANMKLNITMQAFSFDNIREFLKKHNVSQIAVDMGVIGKDFMENPTQTTRIARFFVNFDKHSNLEEAYADAEKSGTKPYFLPLSQGEIQWMDGQQYRNSRSQGKSEVFDI